jgi:peptidoglycan/LPS O-acetylase OafA/YrhL
MGKYTKFQRPVMNRSRDTHPIWRGIGCLMMIVVPLVSYAGALKIVEYGLKHYWPFPAEFLGYIQFPQWVWRAPVLPLLVTPIANFKNMGAVLVFTLGLIVLLAAIFSTVYAMIYRTMGPSRYTTFDAPPSKYKPKHYKR